MTLEATTTLTLTEGEKTVLIERVIQQGLHQWRQAWTLWQLAGPDSRQKLARVLSKLLPIQTSRRHGPPAWLPREEGRLSQVLAEPIPAALQGIKGKLLFSACSELQLMPQGPIPEEILLGLVRKGTNSWWLQHESEELLAWGDKQVLPIRAAIVERILLASIGRKLSAEQLLDYRPLLRVVDRWLGDPDEQSGRWINVSREAVSAYEDLLVRDQLARILEAFRTSASETDRATFWAGKEKQITDARFYEANDMAVCMLVIRGALFIEFGNQANACYVYSSPKSRLRQWYLPIDLRAGDFKDTLMLDLEGTEEVSFIKRLMHRAPWQMRFNEFIEHEI